MEFFSKINTSIEGSEFLKNALTISSLPSFTDSILNVISDSGDTGEIYSIWGQFDISRELIRYGVRFSLTSCPLAFAWTITLNPDQNEVIAHSTFNKTDADPEFVETIVSFMSEWELSIDDLCKQHS